MLKEGELHVWRIRLDEVAEDRCLPLSAEERDRAARFRFEKDRIHYVRSHGALRSILAAATNAPLQFAFGERGKPYLSGAPEIRFNLSHSHGMALVGVALGVDIGVDIERARAIPNCEAIAQRFFPPSEAAGFAAAPEGGREREFFRRWTRIEAALKAQGIGLLGAGAELPAEWVIREIDAGADYVAAVAAGRALTASVHDY